MYTFIQLKFAIGNNFIYICTADVKSSLFFFFLEMYQPSRMNMGSEFRETMINYIHRYQGQGGYPLDLSPLRVSET